MSDQMTEAQLTQVPDYDEDFEEAFTGPDFLRTYEGPDFHDDHDDEGDPGVEQAPQDNGTLRSQIVSDYIHWRGGHGGVLGLG